MTINMTDKVFRNNEPYSILRIHGSRPNNIFVVDLIKDESRNLLQVLREEFVRFGKDNKWHFYSDNDFEVRS